VVEAATAEAAAALSRGVRPNLVILDLGPASSEGLSVLRELKAEPRLGSAPLVLLGDFDDLEDIREGLRLGARDTSSGARQPPLSSRAGCVPGWTTRRGGH
jgi:DNA-binding NarL/FixJ family response regulator